MRAFILVIVALVFVGVAQLGLYLILKSRTHDVREQIASVDKAIGGYGSLADELSALKLEQGQLEDRLDALTGLHQFDSQVLDILQQSVLSLPAKAWWVAFKQEDNAYVLEGFAADNSVIADFMRALQTALPAYTVELNLTKSQSFHGNPSYRFSIALAPLVGGENGQK